MKNSAFSCVLKVCSNAFAALATSCDFFSRLLPLLALVLLNACSTDASHKTVKAPLPLRPSAELLRDLPPAPTPRQEPRSRYGNPASYNVFGVTYKVLETAEGFEQKGVASWYGPDFHGKRTSSGEAYDMHLMTAAHKTLPLPCYVQVTNLDNGLSTVVRVNDRGPFVKDRIIDLSYSAAKRLGVDRTGTANVAIKVLMPGENATPSNVAASNANTRSDPDETERTAIGSGNGASGWFVQVGAFSQRAAADLLAARVRAVVGHPVLVQTANANERPIFRVRVGPLSNRDDAESVQDFLDDKDFDDPALVAP